MRGPGGCVRSKRLMAIGFSPWLREQTSVARRSADGKQSAVAGRRLRGVNNPAARDVDAEGDQRLLTDDPKGVRPVRRQGDRDAGFEGYDALLAREPSLAAALEHGQHLDIGVGVQAGLVAWRRGLDAGTDRQTGTGVVADGRLV